MPGLGRELTRSLAGTDVIPRLVVDRPEPEWRLGALTVVVGRRRARLRYARELVGWAPPRAAAIAHAYRRARDRLEAGSTAPDAFLARLRAAYAQVLAQLRRAAGERAPLVLVRARLTDTSRAQFAWDLARLRRERRLVVDGGRIDLGIATGHAAIHRSRVVWIEDDAGGGAFYETFRLIHHHEVRA